MLNLNHIEVIGNLTKDPELRYTPNNQAVCSISVATNRRYRDQNNNWVDSPPEYHDIVIWGQLGERCNQVLHKGERIFVSGRLQTRSWEAQDGSKRYKTEIVADSIIGPDQVNKNLGNAGDSLGNTGFSSSAAAGAPDFAAEPVAGGAKPTPAKAAPKKAAGPSDEEINIDDIPF
ncbi:MAG: single-stranded DNA-binding protein [bacterium]